MELQLKTRIARHYHKYTRKVIIMHDQSSVFCTCDKCGSNIRYGDSLLQIGISKEQFEEEGSVLISINVFYTGVLMTLCRSCDDRLGNFNEMRKSLKSSLEMHPDISKRIISDHEESECEWGLCQCCSTPFVANEIRFTIERIIGTISRRSETGIPELSVTDCEAFTSYCIDCGSIISNECVRKALID